MNQEDRKPALKEEQLMLDIDIEKKACSNCGTSCAGAPDDANDPCESWTKQSKITTEELMALPEGSQLTKGTRLWFGVHRTHCCTKHGCKYRKDDCPVVKGRIDQQGPCEQCGLEESGYYDDEETAAFRKNIKELEEKNRLLEEEVKQANIRRDIGMDQAGWGKDRCG